MESNNWYAVGTQAGINCLNCNSSIVEVGYTHTDTGVCPYCKTPCIFYGIGKDNVIQVIPDYAPDSFRKFISWVQTDLSEMEFLFLIGAIKRIGRDLPVAQNPPD